MFDKVLFEKKLRNVFDEFVQPSELNEAMAYSLFAGGKRFRPMLMINTFGDMCRSAVSPKRRMSVDLFACAIECIHTYSLIHDDLPSMDDDDFRRGKPTAHRVFGESLAILAGDALLNLAYEICIKAVSTDLCNETLQAASAIARASGASGMVLGQAYDIKNIEDDEGDEFYEQTGNDFERIKNINILKTSKMISASIVAGAVLSGADRHAVAAAEQLGENIGLIFQITDDLIDIYSDKEISGKSTGRDRSLRKITLPAIFGVERTSEYLRELQKQALTATQYLGLDAVGIEINKLIGRKK